MDREQVDSLYYYHIFNLGVDKRQVFIDKWDYVRFIESMSEFNQADITGGLYNKKVKEYREEKVKESNSLKGNWIPKQTTQDEKLIDIICYCLNPNH